MSQVSCHSLQVPGEDYDTPVKPSSSQISGARRKSQISCHSLPSQISGKRSRQISCHSLQVPDIKWSSQCSSQQSASACDGEAAPTLLGHLRRDLSESRESSKNIEVPNVGNAECLPGAFVSSSGRSSARLTLRSLTSCFGQEVVGGEQNTELCVSDNSCRRIVWRFFQDRYSSMPALWYSRFATSFIILSVLSSYMGRTIATSDTVTGTDSWLFVAEMIVELVFACEFLARVATCPDKFTFCVEPYNIIDFASIAPLFIRTTAYYQSNNAIELALLFAPLLRLLKLLRRFETFRLLVSAFSMSLEALPVLLYTLFVIALTFASLIYCVESDIDSLHEAMWFTIVTVSTVGFGDVVPTSVPGRMLVMVLIFISVLFTAIPIGIVGNSFAKVWEDRERLLVMHRIRDYVQRRGFTAMDVQAMFRVLDEDDSEYLSYEEFERMFQIMDMRVQPEIIAKTFQYFDCDECGTIDFFKFLKGLFPQTHQYVRRRTNSFSAFD